MRKLDIGVWLSILNVLDAHWKEIGYNYKSLPLTVRKVITPKDFEYLVQEIKTLQEEKKNGVVYK